MNRKITVNTRLLKDIFPNHISTFSAFCELINNSIQAKANKIKITIDYTEETEFYPLPIKKLEIEDDGIGVHSSELELKTLDIATGNKLGGKGIGRFSAFQIGKEFTVETIGYNQNSKTFTKSVIPFSIKKLEEFTKLGEIDIDTKEEVIDNNSKTGYKVTIDNFYTLAEIQINRNRKIVQPLLKEKIKDAIFERYPLEIFNKKVTFYINNEELDPASFVIGEPVKKIENYTDLKGDSSKVMFNLIRVRNIEEIRAFLTVKNAGIDTVANSFKYEANWLSPKIGGWFIYIQSDVVTSDNFRNIDLDGLDEELNSYRKFLQEKLNEFFKEKNIEFENFTDKLKNDDYYPYKSKDASSKSKELLFDKLAYLVEDKYNILTNNERLREIVYPLIDRTIENGELEKILREILKLDKKVISQFHSLIEKSDLEDIIEFSEKVATKKEDLEFLEKITYSDISNSIKERKQLHKYLEKMLWVFGEQYNESTKLLSDRNLENNLTELRDSVLSYKPSKEDDNIIEYEDKKIKSITDLFLYNERIIDSERREVLIVELKAPKVKISNKEIEQVMKYASEIEEKSKFSNKIKYKILLVSSDFTRRVEKELKGRQKDHKGDNPYFFYKNEDENIEVSVIRWSELFENTKRKLSYLSNVLKTKDIDIEEKTKKDFSEIEVIKIRSTFRRVANN